MIRDRFYAGIALGAAVVWSTFVALAVMIDCSPTTEARVVAADKAVMKYDGLACTFIDAAAAGAPPPTGQITTLLCSLAQDAVQGIAHLPVPEAGAPAPVVAVPQGAVVLHVPPEQLPAVLSQVRLVVPSPSVGPALGVVNAVVGDAGGGG